MAIRRLVNEEVEVKIGTVGKTYTILYVVLEFFRHYGILLKTFQLLRRLVVYCLNL
jgi:hypothetical protein